MSNQSTNLFTGALLDRMIEDMTMRDFVRKTRQDYLRHVEKFTAFLERPPETATQAPRCLKKRAETVRGPVSSKRSYTPPPMLPVQETASNSCESSKRATDWRRGCAVRYQS